MTKKVVRETGTTVQRVCVVLLFKYPAAVGTTFVRGVMYCGRDFVTFCFDFLVGLHLSDRLNSCENALEKL